MAKVYSKAANADVEVDAAEAQRGIAAGEYVLRDGAVKVIGPEHRTGTVDAAEAATAFAQGWRLADDSEVAEAKIRREESGVAGSLLGTVEQGLAGASLGLSTLGANAILGDEYTERARIRREELGEAGTAAEVIGGIGAALIPGLGQVGLAARGGAAARGLGTAARAVASPTAAAMRLGGAVERGAAALGAGRAGSLAARGATEGGLAAAGAEVHESVLGGHEITAERLGAAGLTGVLFGGALGGGAPLAGDLAIGAMRAPVSATRKVLGRAIGAPGGEVSERVARTWDREGLADFAGGLAERAAPFSDARPDVAGRAMRTAIREPQRVTDLLSRRSQIEEAAAATVRDDLGKVRTALDEARIVSQGEAKLRRLTQEFGEPGTARRVLKDLDAPNEIRGDHAKIRSMLDEADAINARTGHTSYSANALRKLQGLSQRLEAEIGEDAGSAFAAYDRFKRDVGVIVNETGGFSGKPKFGAMDNVVETNKLARDLYARARERLEDAAIFGDGATTIQKELNASWSHAAAKMAEFSDEASGSGLSRIFKADGSINMQQALRLVRQYNRAGGESVVSALDDVLEAQLGHLRVVRKHYDLPTEAAAKIDAAEAGVKELRQKMQQQSKDAADLADLMELRGAESGSSVSIGIGSNLGTAGGALLGSALGGPIGALGGMVAGAALRPYTATRTIASLMALADRVDLGILKGTGSLASKIAGTAAKVERGAKRVARGVGVALPIPTVFATQSHQARQEHVERVRDVATMLASRPEALAERVERLTESFSEHAPRVARQLQVVTQRAAMHLARHIPPSYTPPLSGRKPHIEPVAFESFARRVEAIEDPIATIGRLSDGTFTREHADALREVYPEMYADAQRKVMDAILQAQADGHRVPHEARVQAGIFLDVTTDASLDPKMYAGIQAAMAPSGDPQQPEPAQGGKVRAGANVDLAAGATTATDKIASGVARA
jgi:hypothetical protein